MSSGKRPSKDDPPSGGDKKKLVQTKLNFPRVSSSASSSGRSSPYFPSPAGVIVGGDRGPDGLYRHLQWVRKDNDYQGQDREQEEVLVQLREQKQGEGQSPDQQGQLSGGGLADDGYCINRNGSLEACTCNGKDCKGLKARNRPRKRAGLAAIAIETRELIPGVLKHYPLPGPSIRFTQDAPPPALVPAACPKFVLPRHDPEAPGFPGTRIRVVDADSFDAALSLGQVPSDKNSILVLNLANAITPGGGFVYGAMAQEEELCYRSTLYHTLTPAHYPLPRVSAIYSPEVVIFRAPVRHNHRILKPHEFRRVSVVSVAAEQNPPLTAATPPRYARLADRNLMRDKIRLILRVAAHHGHTRIVLGALGCGVFNNPSEEVAEIFLEVFMQEEFTGGWWRDVVFAVLDTANGEAGGDRGTGPYGSFLRVLDEFPV